MKSKFKNLAPQTETLLTVIVLGGLLLYYFFIYIPSNRERVEKLRYEFLGHTIEKINFRLDNYQALLNNYKNIYEEDPAILIRDSCPGSNSSYDFLNAIKLRNREWLIITRQNVEADSSLRFSKGNAGNNGIILRSAAIKNKENPDSCFEAQIQYKYFFAPLLRQGLFTDFIVFNKSDGRLLYETKPLGIRLHGKTDSLFHINNGLLQPGIADVICNGTKAKMFMQVTNYPLNEEWVIAGILPLQEYNSECTMLDSHVLILLVFVLVLFILSIPLLKFLVLGKNEQIKIGDLVRTGFSCMLIVSVSTFMFFSQNQDCGAFKNSKGTATEQKDPGIKLAKLYAEKLRNEIDSSLTLLLQVNKQYLKSRFSTKQNAFISGYTIKDTCANLLRIDSSTQHLMKSESFLKVFWLNDKGKEVAQISNSSNQILYGKYAERNYFKDAVNGKLYTFYSGKSDTIRYAFEPVFSWEADRYNMVMSIPVNDSKSTAKVAATSFRLSSLEHLIIPQGFQFAIVDNEGRMLLHSDTSRNLNDNILYYDNAEGLLQATLSTSTIHSIDTKVDNKSVHVHIAPILNTPFFVAIISDYSYADARDEQIFVKTWLLLAILIVVLCFELIVILYTHQRKNTQLRNYSFNLAWLFPRTTQIYKYQFISRVNLIQFLILVAFMLNTKLFDYLFVLANGILLSTYYANTIQIHNRNSSFRYDTYFSFSSGKLMKSLIALVILVNGISYFCYSTEKDYITPAVLFTIISFTAFILFYEYTELKVSLKVKWTTSVIWLTILTLLIAIRYLVVLNNPEYEIKELLSFYCLVMAIGFTYSVLSRMKQDKPKYQQNKFTGSFTMVILTRLLITSALPIAAFYHYCFEYQQELNVKNRLLSVASKIDEQLKSGIDPEKVFSNIEKDSVYVKNTAHFYVDAICLTKLKGRNKELNGQPDHSLKIKWTPNGKTKDVFWFLHKRKQNASDLICDENLKSFITPVDKNYWESWMNLDFMEFIHKDANRKMNRMKWERRLDKKIFFNSPGETSCKLLFIPDYPILHEGDFEKPVSVFYLSSDDILSYPLPSPSNGKGKLWWAVLIILWIGFYSLIHYFVKTLFGAKLPEFLNYEKLHRNILHNEDLSKLLFVTGLPGSGKTAYITNELYKKKYKIKNLGVHLKDKVDWSAADLDKNEPWKDGVIVDLFLIPDSPTPGEDEARKWASEVTRALDPRYAIVIINHFEYNHMDHFTNRIKLNFLEQLMGLSHKKIVIVSSLDNQTFLYHIEEQINDPVIYNATNLQQLSQDFVRWNTLLGHFTNIYIPLSMNDEVGAERYEYSGWRAVIDSECRHTKVLAKLKPDLSRYFEDLNPHMDHEQLLSDIVLKIQSTVEQYYFILWSSLTMEEKLLVYDLAQDGLVNTINKHAIFILINKGVFKYEHGQLRLFNKSFRNFVLTSIGPLEVAKLEMSIKSGNSWKRYKNPVLLLVTGLLFFVLYSDQQRFNDVIIPYLTAVIALIPVVMRLYTVFNQPETSKS
ncbi:MAG: cache domain-containing protein [Bacteroidota bacterium]